MAAGGKHLLVETAALCYPDRHAPRKSQAMSSVPRRRRLELDYFSDIAIVHFVDRKLLDEQNLQIIGEQLFSLIDEEGWRKILLNFDNIEYISKDLLGKLITLNKKLQQAGGKLVLCAMDPQIYEIFEITRLDKLFKIVKDEQAGLVQF
jgi:anti-sigma B factor antagonist